MKKNFKKLMAIVMVLTMVFAMSATAFANTNTGTATITLYIVDETGGYPIDGVTVEAGQTVYEAIESYFDYYEPDWDSATDPYNGDTVYYLQSFVGYSDIHVDGGANWSQDWSWMYTVNDVMPSFPDNANHGKTMSQYTIQPNDQIDVAYTLVYTTWDATTTTTTYTPWK